MAKHTPGKIRQKPGQPTRLETCDGEGTVIASTWTSSFAPPKREAVANASRITALWNAAAETPAATPEARVLQLEAQVFAMARWLLVEKRLAEEAIKDGIMVPAHEERRQEIDGLLSGSEGESFLAGLVAEREELKAALLRIQGQEARDAH